MESWALVSSDQELESRLIIELPRRRRIFRTAVALDVARAARRKP